MKRFTRTTSSRAIRRNALAALAFAVALTGAARAADQTPSQVVDGLASQVLPVLRDANLSADQKRDRVEQIAYQAMDFATLSRLVLARNWTKFSAAQQQEFEAEFKRHLSVTYGRNVESYNNETVTILGERAEGRGDVTVLTKILRGGNSADIVVDYRLRQRDGQWKIIDVIVENVSLVSNFRSQFQDIVSNGGPDRLLALLKEKNAKGESLQPPPTPAKELTLQTQPFSPDADYCVYCHAPAAGQCAACGALCCADCVELVMGIAAPRATCHSCLQRGPASGLSAFLRVALLAAAMIGVALAVLVYLTR